MVVPIRFGRGVPSKAILVVAIACLIFGTRSQWRRLSQTAKVVLASVTSSFEKKLGLGL
jgi:hypothetical protein